MQTSGPQGSRNSLYEAMQSAQGEQLFLYFWIYSISISAQVEPNDSGKLGIIIFGTSIDPGQLPRDTAMIYKSHHFPQLNI